MGSSVPRRDLPDATVSRLSGYLRILTDLAATGVTRISSDELAAAAGTGSAQVRKDLSYVGGYGTRGVGYDVAPLAQSLGLVLGAERTWPVILVGLGNLGRALSSYAGFAERGFAVVGLFDADPKLVGRRLGGQQVRPMSELPDCVRDVDAQYGPGVAALAVIATPSAAAQSVCDELAAAGIRSILSFAGTPIVVPDGVELRQVDLATELQVLAVRQLAGANPGGGR